jgi:hypothetical protein
VANAGARPPYAAATRRAATGEQRVFARAFAQPPLAQPRHTECHRGDELLQMGLGQPAVLGPAQATPPDGLRMRALNPSPPSVFDCELGGLLPLPRGLDRLVEGLRPDGELARRIFGLGARRADRTGATGHGMETDAHHGITRDIPAWRSSDAGVSLGTAGLLRLPIDHESTQIIALACPPLMAIGPKGGPTTSI